MAGKRHKKNEHHRTLAETLNEARWAYERKHVDRMSYQAVADLAGEPVARGGLGRSMTIATVRARVAAYHDTLAVAVDDETRNEQRAAELASLDRQERHFAALTSRVDEAATAQRAFAMNTTVAVLVEQRPDLVVLRDERIVLRALEQLRVVGESRRRLLGTDAPTKVEADVTTRDGVMEDLNAALAAIGVAERVKAPKA